jgi:hypothetical protein
MAFSPRLRGDGEIRPPRSEKKAHFGRSFQPRNPKVVITRSKATKQSIDLFQGLDGFAGACHRARMHATRPNDGSAYFGCSFSAAELMQ